MKKMLALLLALVMVLSLAACGGKADQQQAQIDEQQAQIDEQQAQIDELQAALAAAENRITVVAVNVTIDGKATKVLAQSGTVNAVATLEEGWVVDHWCVNGQEQPDSAKSEFSFTADGTCAVEAVVRPEKKLTGINCEFRFVDEKRKAGGEAFTEFVFEEEYTNTVTEQQVEGGAITVEVKAVVPSGKMIDYWLINGVPYYYSNTVSSFVVENLDETTEYEVVLKDKPITYYKVTCDGCNWNGNTSGSVPAGTTLTFVCNGRDAGQFFVGGAAITNEYAKTVTITINSDTHVVFYATIN